MMIIFEEYDIIFMNMRGKTWLSNENYRRSKAKVQKFCQEPVKAEPD